MLDADVDISSSAAYEVYSAYSNPYIGCKSSVCGTLVTVGQGNFVNVPAGAHYLLVLKADGYYTGYFVLGVYGDS